MYVSTDQLTKEITQYWIEQAQKVKGGNLNELKALELIHHKELSQVVDVVILANKYLNQGN